MPVLKSILIFILAGLCEIGGGYLVWQWLKEGKPLWIGLTGCFILVFYAVVATWQPAGFGRVYAAYGGIFIILAVLWGWKVDKVKPDMYEIIGSVICLIGAYIIFFAPRK
ncbi:YnfA family protein [Chitinophaga alhagiae]|uniref:YnfA family protein n=1 Tax=Chitinophaga alhagiae TaxID=2203219 RepID=UPI000E5AEA8A|nr:YnfA family protein [Chitinophaga alhagiae]